MMSSSFLAGAELARGTPTHARVLDALAELYIAISEAQIAERLRAMDTRPDGETP